MEVHDGRRFGIVLIDYISGDEVDHIIRHEVD
jgi:hypothetical protein